MSVSRRSTKAWSRTIAELEALLADPQKILAEIKKETRKLRKDYGDDRRTEITGEEARSYTPEEQIQHQEMVITITQRGYIKCMPASTYRAQHRGGRGITGMLPREADVLQHLLVADTHDTLLFFTNRGKAYSLRCFEIPVDASRTTRGTPAVNLLSLSEGERINAVVVKTGISQEGYILLATRMGEIKRMDFSVLANIRSNGLIAMDIEDGDEVISAWQAGENDDVVMVSEKGMAARFPISRVPTRQRPAGGVRGMRLDPGDRVVSMDVVIPGAQLLVVSPQRAWEADAHNVLSADWPGRQGRDHPQDNGQVGPRGDGAPGSGRH